MRFTADGTRLFVCSEAANTLSVIDVATWTLSRSVETGGLRPVDARLSLDGRRLFVSHGGSGEVRVFSADSLALLKTIPVGPRAWWTALSPSGEYLYVTVGRQNEVAVINTQSDSVVDRIKVGTLPWGITIADVP